MHSLRTFFFHGKVMFRSWDTQLFIFLTIASTWKVLTSKWVLVYKAEPIFDFVFVMLNLLAMKLGELIDIVMDNICRRFFARFRGLGTKFRSFMIYQPTAINQKNQSG